MTQADGKAECFATPHVIRNAEAEVVMGGDVAFETGVFHVEHLDKDGNLLYECTVGNGTTLELAQNLWNVCRADADASFGDDCNQLGAEDRVCKLGTFKYVSGGTAGLATLSTADTYFGIQDGSNTFTGGDGGSDRVFNVAFAAENWGPDAPTAADACVLKNNTTAVPFTGSEQLQVAGAYVYTCDATDTGGANKGCLIAAASFGSLIAEVAPADTLNVTFTGTLTVSV